jgi:hypothetical protein
VDVASSGRTFTAAISHIHATLSSCTRIEPSGGAGSDDRIAHQRAVVLHHEEGGLDSAIARAILDQLGTLQRAHIAERDRLLAEAALENKSLGK